MKTKLNVRSSILRKIPMISLILVGAATASFAHAEEKMTDIGLQKEVKEQVINVLQATIARHETMTRDQIIADLQNQIGRNSAVLAAHGIPADPKNLATSLAFFDKDTLVAFENEKLQSLMTSGNAMFLLTRLDLQDSQAAGTESLQVYGDGFLLPFALALDIALLPFDFIVSAVSGF